MREAEREAASHSFDDLSDEEIRKEELEKDEVRGPEKVFGSI